MCTRMRHSVSPSSEGRRLRVDKQIKEVKESNRTHGTRTRSAAHVLLDEDMATFFKDILVTVDPAWCWRLRSFRSPIIIASMDDAL